MTLIVIAAYVIAAVIVACRIGSHIAWYFHAETVRSGQTYPSIWERAAIARGTPSVEQWFGAMCAGVMAGAVWPLVIVLWPLAGRLFAAPVDKRVEQQRRRIEELERENARLDKELGIQ